MISVEEAITQSKMFETKFKYKGVEYNLRVYNQSNYKPVLMVALKQSVVATGLREPDGEWKRTGGKKDLFKVACKIYSHYSSEMK